MISLRRLFLILLVVTAGEARAAHDPPHDTWHTPAEVLATRNDANSLTTAAALQRMSESSRKGRAKMSDWDGVIPTSLELITRASELAPQNAAINWLHLQLCIDAPGCDTRDVATVMRWVDADNSAAWLTTLATAQRDGDSTEVDRVLADMARGGRFDIYWNRLVVTMYDALRVVRRQLPKSYDVGDAARLTELMTVAAAEILPPFGALDRACREPAAQGERREDCRKLAKIMQRGDSILVQLLGFSIERRLVAPDSKEARMIADRRQSLEWRNHAAEKLDKDALPWSLNAHARARLAAMRRYPREEDVCTTLLRSHHIKLELGENRK